MAADAGPTPGSGFSASAGIVTGRSRAPSRGRKVDSVGRRFSAPYGKKKEEHFGLHFRLIPHSRTSYKKRNSLTPDFVCAIMYLYGSWKLIEKYWA